MLLQLTVDPGPQLRPGGGYGMDAAFMSLERNAPQPCVPRPGRGADAKSGISRDSTIYNVLPLCLG